MPITCKEMAQVIATAQAWAASLSIIADVTVECVSSRRAYLLARYGSASPQLRLDRMPRSSMLCGFGSRIHHMA